METTNLSQSGDENGASNDFQNNLASDSFPVEIVPFYQRKQFIFLIGLFIIILDQLTKWRIERMIPLNTSLAPIPALYPYFQLTHISNTGSVFGLFPQAKWVITVLAVVISISIVYFNFQLPAQSFKLRLTMGLLFGGAMGNLIDRIRIGHVTDFMNINLRPLLQPLIDIPILDWAVFNVADMAISSGIALMAYIMLREPDLVDETRRTPEEGLVTGGEQDEVVNSD